MKYRYCHPFLFLFLPHPQESSLLSASRRQCFRRTGRIFPEHVEQSLLDPEYSFVTVGRIPRTRFAKQRFAQLRTNYVRQKTRTMFAKQMFTQLRTSLSQFFLSDILFKISQPGTADVDTEIPLRWELPDGLFFFFFFYNIWDINVTESIVPWPFNLFFFFFFSVVLSLFWLGGSFMALIIQSVKTCALGPPRPLSASVPAKAGGLFVSAVIWAPMLLVQGRAYTVSWLVWIKVML